MTQPLTLEVGAKAPAFTALDQAGNEHHLTSYLEEGKTVVCTSIPRIPPRDAQRKRATFVTT